MAFGKSNPFEEMLRQANKPQDESFSSTELMKISAITEGIKQLQDFQNIFSITTLSNSEAVLFSKAKIIGSFWDVPQIEIILRDLAMMKLSINGKRADQIVDVLIAMNHKKGIKEKVKDFISGGEKE